MRECWWTCKELTCKEQGHRGTFKTFQQRMQKRGTVMIPDQWNQMPAIVMVEKSPYSFVFLEIANCKERPFSSIFKIRYNSILLLDSRKTHGWPPCIVSSVKPHGSSIFSPRRSLYCNNRSKTISFLVDHVFDIGMFSLNGNPEDFGVWNDSHKTKVL